MLVTESVSRHAFCEALRRWIAERELNSSEVRLYETDLHPDQEAEDVWLYYEGGRLWSVVNGYSDDSAEMTERLEAELNRLGWWYQPIDGCTMQCYQANKYAGV